MGIKETESKRKTIRTIKIERVNMEQVYPEESLEGLTLKGYQNARETMIQLEDHPGKQTRYNTILFQKIEARAIELGFIDPESSLYHRPKIT